MVETKDLAHPMDLGIALSIVLGLLITQLCQWSSRKTFRWNTHNLIIHSFVEFKIRKENIVQDHVELEIFK